MAMGAWLPCSWVKWKMKLVEWRYRRLGLEPRLVEVDQGQTHIFCWVPAGEDSRPALMLLHGFGMDGAIGWERQVGSLARHFRLFVPDLVFFGRSRTSRSERSEVFQAESMKKVLDFLRVEQCNLVGTSYGGMVAYWMASLYPKLVGRVVVASSAVTMGPSTDERLLALCGVRSVKEILVPKDVAHLRLVLSTATVWRVRAVPSFALQDLYDWFYRTNRKEKEELLDGMLIGSVGAPMVPKIDQEVLILWGTKDLIFHPDLAQELKEHVGEKAEVHMMEGGGHVPQIERPREFNAEVLKFLLRH